MQLDIRAMNTVYETSVKTSQQTGVATGPLALLYLFRAQLFLCTHSDYVEVGPWLSDISIASVCVQRFVLT